MTTLTQAPAKPPPERPEAATRPQPQPVAGFAALLRFAVRRDRVRMPVWVAAIIGLFTASTASVVGLYSTPADLATYAMATQGDSAIKALSGPGYGLDEPTRGAVVMNEMELFTFVAVALMSVFLLVRHTRAEEDTDRAELVRAAPVGRHAALAAAVAWLALINLVVALGLVAALVAFGLPLTGSVAFGAATLGVGLLFLAVGAVSAQVASTGRAATALAGATLGACFVVRGAGDAGSGWLSWLSPLGWGQAIRAYADERWWVLALLGAGAACLFAAAVALAARRDLGAGILSQRPGPARAGPRLGSPLGLAVRLQRTAVVAWTVGIGLTGFFYGIVADQADALAENEAVAELFAEAGQASITDSFLATAILMLGLIASGFSISAVLRLRTEELDGRAEPVLATPVSRARWLSGHLVVALGGSIVVMAATGALTGAGYALQTGDVGEVLDLLGAAMATVPALFVLSGVTVALVGLRPRWAPLAWGGLALSAVVGLLGESLDLPQWLRNVSPFEHVPSLPAGSFVLAPVVALILAAAVLVAIGFGAVRHRDIA